MTRIDFHSNVEDQLDYACRLTRKALASGCRLVVRHQDKNQLDEFDRLLWTFSELDFLPHVALRHQLAAHTPVLLSLESDIGESAGNDHTEILLNLSDRVPGDFARYERLIEIVPKEAEATTAGRTRYRHYQQQGFQLNHITAK
jgi:DNA polymerase-3 subunit chi